MITEKKRKRAGSLKPKRSPKEDGEGGTKGRRKKEILAEEIEEYLEEELRAWEQELGVKIK